MPPWVRPPLRRAAGDDSGFTVVEALVSFVVLAVVAVSAVTAIVSATRTTKTSADRAAAANLAQQDLQSARSLRFPAYPQAREATGVKIDGTTYTVSRSVTAKAANGTTITSCPAAPDFTNRPYMIVTSTVTWPPAGTGDRVVMATEIAC